MHEIQYGLDTEEPNLHSVLGVEQPFSSTSGRSFYLVGYVNLGNNLYNKKCCVNLDLRLFLFQSMLNL